MYLQRILLLAVAAIWASACHEAHEHHETQAVFSVTTPLKQDTEIHQEYVARLSAIQHIELRALERGYVTGIYVDEGQFVEKGTKMFQILPQLYDAELQRALAEQKLATIEFQNTKALADKDIVSAPQLAMAEAKLAKANAEWALASTHRKLTEVRAPFSGLMGRFEVRLGSLVDEGELLTTLSDNGTVWAYFYLSEAEYLAYRARPEAERKRPVRLRLANGEMFDQPGKIETIEADFNKETGTIAFRAVFPNPNGLLRHGETGNVVLSRSYPNALLIPQASTFEILDRRFVFVVDASGVIHQRQITVAAELPHVFIVASGLKETDKILVDGLRKVRDGDRITFKDRSPAEVLANLEPPAE